MAMTRNCPNCNKSYDVQPRHVGKRMACKRCGVRLKIIVDGIALDDEPEAEEPAAAPEPASPEAAPEAPSAAAASATRLERRVQLRQSDWLANLRGLADVSTWLFGAGLILLILGWFLPALDAASISGREAPIVLGDAKQQREDQRFQLLAPRGRPDPAALEARKQAEEQLAKAKDAWAKERTELQAAVDEARAGNLKWSYAYRVLMLAGLAAAALGALAFLQPGQPPAKRVVGAAALIAMAILLFLSFLIDAAAVHASNYGLGRVPR